MIKILCPTDFSDSAQNGIAYAAKLAHAIGAPLTLYHVRSLVEQLPLEFIGGKLLSVAAYEKLLDEQSLEISRTFKISCYSEVQPSSTSIVKSIAHKANDYDLLVMGTNGADNLFQFLPRSNTYRTVLQTNVPALIIPPGCLYSEIKNVVYAFDYLRERKLPVAPLIPFVNALKAQLIILQVTEDVHSEDMEEELREMQLMLTEKYSEKINLRFDTVQSSAIATRIKAYVIDNQPDVLAMCTVHRNFLGNLFHKSVIKDLSSVIEYPIFLFHQ